MHGSGPATVGRRRSQTFAVAMAAVLLVAIGATAGAPTARAADAVTVTGSGTVQQFPGSGTPAQSFDITATDDGAGNVSGLLTVQTGAPYFSGEVQCIYVDGDNAVIRASAPDFVGGEAWSGRPCTFTMAGRAATRSTSTGRGLRVRRPVPRHRRPRACTR